MLCVVGVTNVCCIKWRVKMESFWVHYCVLVQEFTPVRFLCELYTTLHEWYRVCLKDKTQNVFMSFSLNVKEIFSAEQVTVSDLCLHAYVLSTVFDNCRESVPTLSMWSSTSCWEQLSIFCSTFLTNASTSTMLSLVMLVETVGRVEGKQQIALRKQDHLCGRLSARQQYFH